MKKRVEASTQKGVCVRGIMIQCVKTQVFDVKHAASWKTILLRENVKKSHKHQRTKLCVLFGH